MTARLCGKGLVWLYHWVCCHIRDRRQLINRSGDVKRNLSSVPNVVVSKQVTTCPDSLQAPSFILTHISSLAFPLPLFLRSYPGRPRNSVHPRDPRYHVFARDPLLSLRPRSDAYSHHPTTASSPGCHCRCPSCPPLFSLACNLTTSQRLASPPSCLAARIFKTIWTTFPIGPFF